MKIKTLLIAIILTISLTGCTSSRKWGVLQSPNKNYQLILYKKDRTMHLTPEIQIHYLKNDNEYYLDSILLPEDNRNTLTYDYNWQSDSNLHLILHCDFCMIEKRVYSISFHTNKKPVLEEINT